MGQFDWQSFLKQWAEEMLDAADETDDLPEEAVEARWLGFPGATEAEIKDAEIRLGMALPSSYREFLKVTNGWRQPDAFWIASAGSLWPVAQINWISMPNQDWAEVAELGQIKERSQTVLAISDNGDGVYLLNPKVVDDKGEWEAWFFAGWVPGAEEYHSFEEMMQTQYREWEEGLPALKGEMTPEGYEVYAARMNIKNV